MTVEAPPRMRKMATDPDRPDFHVPWFVAWIAGKPDYRVIAPGKIVDAVKNKKCWMCGQRLFSFGQAFILGPMCAVTRTISEPPMHVECAEYAVRICPFMVRPGMRRNEKDLPDGIKDAAGFGLKRNPGAVAIWMTESFDVFRAFAGSDGILFRVGHPSAVSWWAEGRRATRAEVLQSIDSGLPILMEKASVDPSPGALESLKTAYDKAMLLLPNDQAVTA